jgi:hypothetical protein
MHVGGRVSSDRSDAKSGGGEHHLQRMQSGRSFLPVLIIFLC